MLLTWFLLVAIMLVAYVVLDGFDLGVGRAAPVRGAHRGRAAPADPHHRPGLGRQRSLAAGGRRNALLRVSAAVRLGVQRLLSAADDRVMAADSARASAIELRMHLESPVWRGLFNGCFGIASLLLTVFYGAALGNVIRGVPLQPRWLLLPAALDRLDRGSAARHPGLVHGACGGGGAGGAGAARRPLRRAQDRRRTEPALPARGGGAVAGAGRC